MKKSLREIIKDKPTEVLRARKKELYQKIIYKRKILDKYKMLIYHMEANCSDFIEEHNMLDRAIFFREGRIEVMVPHRAEKAKKIAPIRKDIKDLTEKEASVLLDQLLNIRKSRQTDPL